MNCVNCARCGELIITCDIPPWHPGCGRWVHADGGAHACADMRGFATPPPEPGEAA